MVLAHVAALFDIAVQHGLSCVFYWAAVRPAFGHVLPVWRVSFLSVHQAVRPRARQEKKAFSTKLHRQSAVLTSFILLVSIAILIECVFYKYVHAFLSASFTYLVHITSFLPQMQFRIFTSGLR